MAKMIPTEFLKGCVILRPHTMEEISLTHRFTDKLNHNDISIEAEQVKCGTWSPQMLFADGFGGSKVGYICSACNQYVPFKGNYCGECGAKMNGGTNDENDR